MEKDKAISEAHRLNLGLPDFAPRHYKVCTVDGDYEVIHLPSGKIYGKDLFVQLD